MNVENVELVRTIITELVNNPRIREAHDEDTDVHMEYRHDDPKYEGDYLDMSWWATRNECGTAACLAGWISEDPRAQALGLKLEHFDGREFVPMYDGLSGEDAMLAFLGWHYASSVGLVFGGHYPNSFEKGLERFEAAVRQEIDWWKGKNS